MTASRQSWEMWCETEGLHPEQYGRTVVLNDQPYRIAGWEPSKPNYPVLLEPVNVDPNRTLARQRVTIPAGLCASLLAIADEERAP